MSLIKSFLERLAGRRTAQSRWDERWADPKFYGEYQLDELAHYSVLAGYVRKLKLGRAVLDVGCGDGVFRTHLPPDVFSRYIGIDFPEAITRANARADGRTSFAPSDMRSYTTAERFGVIIFNESLYYVEDPIGELRRYAGFLEKDGVFLVSMHRKAKSERIWTDIAGAFVMIDRVTIANRAGVEWILGAFTVSPERRDGEGPGMARAFTDA
jgi:2-polyprenyl-3-methyl-5-hydroxy-6-metoxy-1,4-benzoquinol methylase